MWNQRYDGLENPAENCAEGSGSISSVSSHCVRWVKLFKLIFRYRCQAKRFKFFFVVWQYLTLTWDETSRIGLTYCNYVHSSVWHRMCTFTVTVSEKT